MGIFQSDLLFKPLFRLLFVVLQIHNGFQRKFKISLQFSFVPFQIQTQLLLLFQGALKLYGYKTFLVFVLFCQTVTYYIH